MGPIRRYQANGGYRSWSPREIESRVPRRTFVNPRAMTIEDLERVDARHDRLAEARRRRGR